MSKEGKSDLKMHTRKSCFYPSRRTTNPFNKHRKDDISLKIDRITRMYHLQLRLRFLRASSHRSGRAQSVLADTRAAAAATSRATAPSPSRADPMLLRQSASVTLPRPRCILCDSYSIPALSYERGRRDERGRRAGRAVILATRLSRTRPLH